MIDNQIENGGFSYGNFAWWFGIVEKRDDPEKLGRVRVRVLGYHSPNTDDIKPDQLLWAFPVQPITSAAMSGVGTSPTGILEGTSVFGFFRDGSNAQDPIIMGTIGGKPETVAQYNGGDGFKDENETYPREEFLGESDVNRLARNEDIDNTTIKKQRDGEDQKVPTALAGETWNEKSTLYNARYPFNHVRETERGHQEEWDDTKGAERYRRWHRCGTFIEESVDGDSVRRVKRDNYTVILGKDYVHITGDVTLTVGAGNDFANIDEDKMDWKDNIDGEDYEWNSSREVDSSRMNLLVKGDVNIECEGDWYQKVHGKMELYAGEDLQIKSGGTVYIDGSPNVHLNKPGPTLSVESISAPDWNSNTKRGE